MTSWLKFKKGCFFSCMNGKGTFESCFFVIVCPVVQKHREARDIAVKFAGFGLRVGVD